MTQNPFINALSAALYIVVVSFGIFSIPQQFEHEFSILAPIAFLSLFVFSAATMGYIFLSQPIQLFLSGEKKEAVQLFVKTLLTFAVVTAAIVTVGVLVALNFPR